MQRVDGGRGDGEGILLSASDRGGGRITSRVVLEIVIWVVSLRVLRRVKRRGNVFLNVGVERRRRVGEDRFEVFELRAGDVDGEVGVLRGDETGIDFDCEGKLVAAKRVWIQPRMR